MAKANKQLPGMEDKKHDDIIAAAEQYSDAVSERVSRTNEERDCHDRLITAMQKHGLTSYRYGDLVVTIGTGKAKAKVTISKNPDADDESE